MTQPHGARDDRSELVDRLQETLECHELWTDRLNRALACHVALEPELLAQDGHLQCELGAWLATALGVDPVSAAPLAEIARAHRGAHDAARALAAQLQAGATVRPGDYDLFVKANQQLRRLARALLVDDTLKLMHADPLTGAANRLTLRQRLGREIALAGRGRVTACLILLDIDHFKRVNDTYGHPVGDRVLTGVAKCITARVRAADLFVRYGGEEFLICLQRADLEAASLFCERLREAISAYQFTDESGGTFHVTASFGVTPLSPDMDVDSAIARADRALYEAKANGRNRIEIAVSDAA